MTQYTSPVDALLIYTRGDEVLLALRSGTGYADGQWNLPSGKLDAGERVDAAMCREAREELGIVLYPHQLRFATLLHWRNPEEQLRLGVFFHVEADPQQHGTPTNAEPHKCAGPQWFPIDRLPADIVRYSAVGIDLYRTGTTFAAADWPALPEASTPDPEPEVAPLRRFADARTAWIDRCTDALRAVGVRQN